MKQTKVLQQNDRDQTAIIMNKNQRQKKNVEGVIIFKYKYPCSHEKKLVEVKILICLHL